MPANEFPLQVKLLLKNLTFGKKVTLLCLAAGTIIGFVFLITWSGEPDYQLLYSNLASEDAGAILDKLKEQKIPYQISSDGGSILIPRERVYETRLELAGEGLPKGGSVGFEIFDNTKLGMTDFVQNVNYQRACQGELSRTINGLAEVESSRVHIVMPPKSLFIEEEEPATASVVVKLRPGRVLKDDQVQGIVHLVSSSVSGLSPENVTIVDNSGRMLAGLKSTSVTGQVSSDQLAFQQKMEKNLEERIRTMLEAALGHGKAAVRVSCALDFKEQEKTEERYQPDNRVVRSEQVVSENSTGKKAAEGIPGVMTRLPKDEQKKANGSGPDRFFAKQDRMVNYEIGKVISRTKEPVGELKRVSVAVMIDGTYKLEKAGRKKEVWKYVPRSQEEMNQFEEIVKRAMNFDANRGDEITVVNTPFESGKLRLATAEEPGAEEGWLSKLRNHSSLIKKGFLGFCVLLSFIFIIRPLVRWLTTNSIPGGQILGQLPKTVEEIEREYGEGMKTLPFRNQVLQMATGDVQNSVHAVRGWLKEK
jgi:flagellar M-ring protein FliF